MAKASAAGSTHYVPEGWPAPADLPPEVRLVGPGAPEPPVINTLPEAVVDEVARRLRLADDGSGAAPESPAAAADEPAPALEEPAAASEPEPDPEPEPEPEPAAPDEDEDDGPTDYNAIPIRVLREIVRDRGLPVAGSKAELVARLEENDAAAA